MLVCGGCICADAFANAGIYVWVSCVYGHMCVRVCLDPRGEYVFVVYVCYSTYVYIGTCVFVCMCVCGLVCAGTCMFVSTYVCMSASVCKMCVCKCMYVCRGMCVQVHL